MASGIHGEKRPSALGTLACLAGVAALAALWVAAWGYREGRWDYGFALLTISRYAALAGAGAVVVGLIGLGASLPGGARRGAVISLVGIVAGGAAAGLIGERYATVRASPFIHDISTDLEDPPAFLALLERRSAEGASNPPGHPGAEVALQQRAGYPGVRPLAVVAPPAETFEHALALAEDSGWEIVAADPAALRIEAVDTSRFYEFKDDIVIRIAPRAGGSKVDMRSKSRVGRSDVGVNAARIERFLAALRDSAGPAD